MRASLQSLEGLRLKRYPLSVLNRITRPYSYNLCSLFCLYMVKYRKRGGAIVRNFKQLIAGIIIGAIVFGAIPVLATNGTKSISVVFKNIKVTLGGKAIKPSAEPFQYAGKVYVPIDLMAQVSGKKVNFNTKTNAVEIGNTASTATTPSPTNIKNASELKSFLVKNYSTLKTCIGTAKFTFGVEENDKIYNPYDYRIKVYYDDKYFYGAYTNIKYTTEQKSTLAKQLREHQKNIAIVAIKAMPAKKFYGSYYEGYWKYPNLKIDWQEIDQCAWINFTLNSWNSIGLTDYEEAKLTDFKWHSEYEYNTFFGEEDPPLEK